MACVEKASCASTRLFWGGSRGVQADTHHRDGCKPTATSPWCFLCSQGTAGPEDKRDSEAEWANRFGDHSSLRAHSHSLIFLVSPTPLNLKASIMLWKTQVLAWPVLAAAQRTISHHSPQGAPGELEKQQRNGNMKSKDENYSHCFVSLHLSPPTSCSSKAESKTARDTKPSLCSLKTRSLFIFKWKSVKLIKWRCNGLILYSLENIVMAINSSDGACMCEHECLVMSHKLQAGLRLLSLH